MLDLLKKIFRSKKRELEAKLNPTPECTYGGRGEIEIEFWSDDSISFEASLKHTGIPDGTSIEVLCAGVAVGTLTPTAGYAKENLRGQPLSFLPKLDVGDEAELRVNGQTLYKGQFRLD